MTDKKKLKLLHLSQPQRACLEGLSNRRPQLPTDPIRDELVALGLVTQQGARWTLTTTGRKVLAAGSNRRNSGGFSVWGEFPRRPAPSHGRPERRREGKGVDSKY